MKTFHIRASMVGSAILHAAAASGQVITEVTPAPGFTRSVPRYVSPSGVVVGISHNTGLFSPTPTRWASAGGVGQSLASPPGGYGEAFRTSDDGSVVIGRRITETGQSFPAMWDAGGQFIPLPGPGSVSEANGVSADGSIVTGWSATSQGRWLLRWEHGAVDQQFGPSFLSGPCTPDGGTALGTRYLGGDAAALARWDTTGGPHGSLQTLVNFPATWTNIRPPTAITPDASAAVGDAYIGNDVYQSWVWRHSQLADLGIPDGMHSITATAIRGDGDLVTGTALREIRPNSYELRPFIWTPSSGWLTIDAWFESEGLSFPGWTFRSVLFVSPDGQTFAGEGITPAGERHGYVITIPAPGAALVLATTLVYGASRRRPKHPWKTTSRPMRGA